MTGMAVFSFIAHTIHTISLATYTFNSKRSQPCKIPLTFWSYLPTIFNFGNFTLSTQCKTSQTEVGSHAITKNRSMVPSATLPYWEVSLLMHKETRTECCTIADQRQQRELIGKALDSQEKLLEALQSTMWTCIHKSNPLLYIHKICLLAPSFILQNPSEQTCTIPLPPTRGSLSSTHSFITLRIIPKVFCFTESPSELAINLASFAVLSPLPVPDSHPPDCLVPIHLCSLCYPARTNALRFRTNPMPLTRWIARSSFRAKMGIRRSTIIVPSHEPQQWKKHRWMLL